MDGNGGRRILLGWSAHEVASALNEIDTNQYSTSARVRASFEWRKIVWLKAAEMLLKRGYSDFLFSSMP